MCIAIKSALRVLFTQRACPRSRQTLLCQRAALLHVASERASGRAAGCRWQVAKGQSDEQNYIKQSWLLGQQQQQQQQRQQQWQPCHATATPQYQQQHKQQQARRINLKARASEREIKATPGKILWKEMKYFPYYVRLRQQNCTTLSNISKRSPICFASIGGHRRFCSR